MGIRNPSKREILAIHFVTRLSRHGYNANFDKLHSNFNTLKPIYEIKQCEN